MTPLALVLLLSAPPPPAPPPPIHADTYARFPTADECERAVKFNDAWTKSIYAEARALGYYGSGWPVLWGRSDGWWGGGEHARAMRQELAECAARRRAWYALSWVRDPKALPEQRERWASTLRREIGDRRFSAGAMPAAVGR